MNVSNSAGVESSNSVRRPKYKDTKSKNRVFKNTNDKSSYAHVRKVSSSVRIYSYKRETMNSTVIQLILWIVDSGCSKLMNDLDKLFGPLYEEYYATSTPEVSDNFTANTLDNEDTPSSSLIVVEEDEAPQIVS
nr:hypothetical protein [Tanacetum cinerariifolium]